jgi:hypothetical protein
VTEVGRIDEAELLGVSAGTLQARINESRAPKGLWQKGERVWSVAELLRVKARLMAEDAESGGKDRPVHRFERRKAASRP